MKVFAEAYGAFDLQDAIPAVLAIQAEFASRLDSPLNHREWARRCQLWVERNRTELNDGMTHESNAF